MYGAQIWSVVCWRLEAQTKQCCKKSIALLYWCLLVQALLRYCLWFSAATDKFSTQYIRPSLLPTNERGWMGVTTQYSCISIRAGAMYTCTDSTYTQWQHVHTVTAVLNWSSSPNELTSRKAASCGQFSLQRCPQGEQIITHEQSFRTKLLQFRSE